MINNNHNSFGIPNINNNMNIGMNMGMNGGINMCPNYMNNYNNGVNFGNIGGNYMNNIGMNMYGNTMNANNIGMYMNGNNMNMSNIQMNMSGINMNNNMNNMGINMNGMNNMNMNNAGINLNEIKNDNITINIQFPEGKTIPLQISSSKYVHELIDSIKKSFGLKFNFKLKFQNNKNLVNSMTISECGLDNYSNVIISKIEEEDKVKYSFSRYKKASKIGLQNLGDTSYFNAVIQLIGNVRNLASYFINPKNKEKFENNNTTLIFVIHQLFIQLYPYPENEYSILFKPNIQYDAINKIISDKYNGKNIKNPNELIEIFIDCIHKELNTKNKITTKSDPLNKEKIINDGLKDFINSNFSIISNSFFLSEIKSLYCSECKCFFYQLNNIPILKLDISGAYQNIKEPLTILKCLKHQSNKKENSFCSVCKDNKNMITTSNIYSSPNYFIISIDRGNKNQELMNIPFTLENNIDISQYLENKLSPSKYELKGVVSISINENNKYICFGNSPVDNKWYLYNDENVKNIDFNNFKNYQTYIPCILIYKSSKQI